jgi:membrane-associated protein
MGMLEHFIYYLLHIDIYLFSFVSQYGSWTYLALFLIVFCETGLVIFPFLPGDSLLFASGSIAAQTDASLNIFLLLVVLIIASLVGNQLNYFIGRSLGPQVFSSKRSRFLNIKHLKKTHHFYEQHGGKTIIFARFIPVIRTFAPFIAGIGYMKRPTFLFYNLTSAVLWISSLLFFGYFVGGLSFVKNNFSLVIYGIIVISILPPILISLYRKFFPSAQHDKF